MALPGVGTDHAAALLVAAGDNPERLRSEASFASLCGVSPVEASSGKVVRHRLNRGGNRDANRALHSRTALNLCGSDGPGSAHPGVCGSTKRRGQEQAGGHPLPKALRCQGGLPRPSLGRPRCAGADRVVDKQLASLPRPAPLDYRSVTWVNKGKKKGRGHFLDPSRKRDSLLYH